MPIADHKPERAVPFAAFDAHLGDPAPLRRAITEAKLRAEPECLPPLLAEATLDPDAAARVRAQAMQLVRALRAKPKSQGVEGLMHEYALSSEEGVSLMCLAEALLRIPDAPTRDALIRDKVTRGDWLAHVSGDNSLFVNAATWGLAVTGRLVHPIDQRGLLSALTRLVARGGEPIIRRAVDLAMRLMGEQFVSGETIAEALGKSRRQVARGFTHSYDMLGEAATTAADAARYCASYTAAIHAIGKEAAGKGPYRGPGISIKLSALHPRYRRSQIDRVLDQLLPQVRQLALLAKSYDIGFNIDAEEADRLELSLDLLEALAVDPHLADWDGLGFVVQAYGKRCPAVIDYLADLARRADRRLMVRLVKGAYWDAEIKQAQLDGLADFPVYTRKVHTDVAYLACAKRLLAARDAVFPQFATHNAQTLSTILELAGPDFSIGDYEFQCLYGMGEPLYDEVVGPHKLGRPCRIYAPVGAHDTLLAYLVRRLLENGANSSFVNRIADLAVPPEGLVADPVELAQRLAPIGAPHPAIRLPVALFGDVRPNSAGLDFSSDAALRGLAVALDASVAVAWEAVPLLAEGEGSGTRVTILNPADHADVVGTVVFADPATVERALSLASAAAPAWAATPASDRAVLLERAAGLLEARMQSLVGLIIREAGKSPQNAVGEVREAVDFLRYYAAEARTRLGDATAPLGIVVCISPWNFPLSIFLGQVAAALAAGNAVIAKPAEETPLIAAAAIRLLHEAGVPRGAVQFVPGAGDVGAALVANPAAAGVVFTGSTEVARLIQQQLAERLASSGQPIPLIAETAGQNAMVVDSSALTEQVVGDVLASAFDSAGQRCSALRVLCLQEDVADRTLAMLKGAMAELRVGSPGRLATDVGPVISPEAQGNIGRHIEAMRQSGHQLWQAPLAPEVSAGTFIAPTLIELSALDELKGEVFGPVLHVVRFRRADLDGLVDRINGLGYGLTFGLHTRLDEVVERVTRRIRAGNIYVNRNIIGAVVGVQPFGGHGLSGTGPKAGGPLYLRRLLAVRPLAPLDDDGERDPALAAAHLADWLAQSGHAELAARVEGYIAASPFGYAKELAGPVGEENVYALQPRGRILAAAATANGFYDQLGAILATGNDALAVARPNILAAIARLPASVAAHVTHAGDWASVGGIAGALVEGDEAEILRTCRVLAGLPGPIVPVQAMSPEARLDWSLDLLMNEVSTSINTAAAGGNASLMTI
ncbi:MAG: trifunctional transcriptional regulator/proline dehydrogenase/L-glutamate gamma-semialdehyde dehydrogenase [Devosia sp.]|nr:trifunctional transcriptional regulator/proline dehydrogenase/L-glutamate gamma-semialdehyde dehydrogenase [Devosia sp.]